MMLKRKLLATAILGAATAGSLTMQAAHAVAISETGRGSVLMGEMYVARDADYQSTRIKVVNPDLNNAVKAKLVLRSKKHSDECRDILLYLTPGDVAYVDVRLNGSGQPELWSDDDSIMASRTSSGEIKFASQVDGGVTFPMVPARTEPNSDTCAQGHIEVVGAYAVQGNITVPTGNPVRVQKGMSKFELVRIFDQPKTVLNIASNDITNNPTIAANNAANHNTRVRLKGNVEIKGVNDRLMTPMIALASGANNETGTTITHMISNTTFDVNVGNETNIGDGFGVPGDLFGSDRLRDINGALTTSRLLNLYEAENGATTFEVTFPTKYRHIASGRYSGGGASYRPPFYTRGEVKYSVALFNNQEQSAPAMVTDICIVSPCSVTSVTSNFLIHEVNFELITGSSTWNPTSGWFDMTLGNQVGADANGKTWVAGEGVPAIGFAHYMMSGDSRQSVVSPLAR